VVVLVVWEWWRCLDWWFYGFGGLGYEDLGVGIDYLQSGVGVLVFVFAGRLGCSIEVVLILVPKVMLVLVVWMYSCIGILGKLELRELRLSDKRG
jgi:hypothetical protein